MREFADPILGTLRPEPENGWWRVVVNIDGQNIEFTLGGDAVPDAALLWHAHDIVSNFKEFNRRLDQFLESHAARYPGARAEVKRLRLEGVSLSSPQHPNDGMIFFSGGGDDRVWRCDYIQREFRMLGCDT
jgi:hypothetical protein